MAVEPLPEHRSTLRRVDASLEQLHAVLGLARPDLTRTLEARWPSLVGRELARHCVLSGVRDGVLWVSADDPAVAEALRWQSGDLLAVANEMAGGRAVEEVRVRVDRAVGRPSDRGEDTV